MFNGFLIYYSSTEFVLMFILTPRSSRGTLAGDLFLQTGQYVRNVLRVCTVVVQWCWEKIKRLLLCSFLIRFCYSWLWLFVSFASSRFFGLGSFSVCVLKTIGSLPLFALFRALKLDYVYWTLKESSTPFRGVFVQLRRYFVLNCIHKKTEVKKASSTYKSSYNVI